MALDFAFPVGTSEKHVVRFMFDRDTGQLQISVDGATVVRDLLLMSLSRLRDYTVQVGDKERHVVLIRKERPWLFAFLRPQTCHVFVDGKPAGDYTG